VTRALVWLLAIGTIMNLASSSPWERYLQARIAFALALLCHAVTKADRQPTSTVHR
jgi:hypothetical protein